MSGRKATTPPIENKAQYHAFCVYRDLGFSRSYRKTSKIVERAVQTISMWAKKFNWADRIKNHEVVMKENKESVDLLNTKDPAAIKLANTMEQIEAIIDEAFVREENGMLSPKRIKIKTPDELTRLLNAYRQYLETYHSFVATVRPKERQEREAARINAFNIHMEGLSQQDRIAMMKEMKDDTGGDRKPEGNVSEADYTEVP